MKAYTWERIGFYLSCFVCFSQSTTTAHCQVTANWQNIGLIQSGNGYLPCNQEYMFLVYCELAAKELLHLKMSVVFITTLSLVQINHFLPNFTSLSSEIHSVAYFWFLHFDPLKHLHTSQGNKKFACVLLTLLNYQRAIVKHAFTQKEKTSDAVSAHRNI